MMKKHDVSSSGIQAGVNPGKEDKEVNWPEHLVHVKRPALPDVPKWPIQWAGRVLGKAAAVCVGLLALSVVVNIVGGWMNSGAPVTDDAVDASSSDAGRVETSDGGVTLAMTDKIAVDAASAEGGGGEETVNASTPTEDAPAQPEEVRTFPALCNADEPPEGLVAVRGTDDLCIPAREAAVVAALVALPSPPGGYDDDNPVSLLLSPRAALEEESALTSHERSSLAARVKSTKYRSWTLGSACQRSWTSAVGRISVNCEFDTTFMSGRPRVQRHQECETIPGDSCGECDDSSDCNGFLCGCSYSRCVFGTCTPCRGHRECDEPEYEVTVPDWTVRATFAQGSASRSLAESAAGGHGYRLLVGLRIKDAFRDVRTRHPTSQEIRDEEYMRGETVVLFDSEYLLHLDPFYVGLVACSGECEPSRPGIDVVDLVTHHTSYAMEYTDGRHVTVSCGAGVCTGSLARHRH